MATFQTEEEAKLDAQALANMLGADFKARWHENMGWHSSANNEAFYVSSNTYRSGKKTYNCLMNYVDDKYKFSGKTEWTAHQGFDTPTEAVLAAIKLCEEYTKRCNETLIYAYKVRRQMRVMEVLT